MILKKTTIAVLAAASVLTPLSPSRASAPKAEASSIFADVAVPTGWSQRALPAGEEFVAPEGDLTIALISVDRAKDANQATLTAWRLYRGVPLPAPTVTSRMPTHNGWDEQTSNSYLPARDGEILNTIALRHVAKWLVVIVSGSNATSEKRSAGLKALLASLRPPGFTRETFAGRPAARLTASRIAQLRDFVTQSMHELDVPGVGLALIENGKIVYEGGIGVRTAGQPEAVDARTLFPVASNTKGMTTLLLSKLVDLGKLQWNEPVTTAYPPFRLGNADTTRQVLIRHLVCACTGLPRRDSDWFFNTKRSTPASATFDQLAISQPTSAFGGVYQYNNLMASAAGYIAGQAVYPNRELGAAYDAAMQAYIFDPLDMKDTTFDFARALSANHASPHDDTLDGAIRVVPIEPNYTAIPYRPAGGAWSSAHDMMLYVRNELSLGVAPDGRRLYSAENMIIRRQHGVPTGESSWYGMGLIDDRSWGVSVIHHGGSAIGYKSEIMFLPDTKIGAVLLTNAASGQLMMRPFMRRLLEIIYHGRPEAAADITAAAGQLKASRAALLGRLTIPALDSATLAGRYYNENLGPLTVESKNEQTRFIVTSWSSAVGSLRTPDGKLSYTTIDPGLQGLTFVTGTSDGKRTLTMIDGQHKYVFVEQ